MKEILVGNSDLQKMNRGLFFGENLFTSFSTLKGTVPFFEMHLDRLKSGLKCLYPELKYGDTILTVQGMINSILEAEEVDLYIRITPLICLEKKNITIQINYKEYDNSDFKLKKITTVKVNNSFSNLNQVTKMGNYSESFLKKEEVISRGYDDYLKINREGKILEASTSNVIFVKGDRVYSPAPEKMYSYHEGIILKNLLPESIKREAIYISELKRFDYCFLTNCVDYLVCVEAIDKFLFKDLDSKNKNDWINKLLKFT